MQGDVQVGGRAEALDEGDGTGSDLIALLAGLWRSYERKFRSLTEVLFITSITGSVANE